MLSLAQAKLSGGAMPLSKKFDGPNPLKISDAQNKFAANSDKPLPNAGTSS